MFDTVDFLDMEGGYIARWHKGTNYAELLNSREEQLIAFKVSDDECPTFKQAEQGAKDFFELYKYIAKKNYWED
jgi:hypothetical protein